MVAVITSLPPLREDLRLLPAARAADGSPTWTLYDPASHRFMRIDWQEFEILARWDLGSVAAIVEAISRELPLPTSENDVAEMVQFAARAGWLRPLGAQSSQQLADLVQRRKLSPFQFLLKNYLFLRIPLIDPDRLLTSLLRRVEWLFQPWFPWVLALAAGLGLFLVGRQWDSFTHELSYGFSPEGIVITALALSFAKVVHEFGHGLAAKHFGCRVPAMGVAFLVLWPVLWTDVTDSWKLADRHKRLVIDSAGMAAELMLAVLASLAWSVLPDGPARSAMFLLAGSTWLVTLAVNLNPLMRFDGYFLLSDGFDVPNLQDRAFALGRWWLREALFGLGALPPEYFPLKRQRLLVGFALAVWVYRFFMFLGIALLVYHLAFKLLGLFLLAVELWWFITRPIVNEISAWMSRKGDLRWNWPTLRSAGMAGLVLLALVVPWRGSLTAPALLRAGRQVALATAQSGQLTQLSAEGATVTEGQAVFTLETPGLALRRAGAVAMATGQRARLSGLSFDRDDSDLLEVSWQEFEHGIAEISQIDAESEGGVVRAPFNGVVVDLPAALRPGLWMGKHEPLGLLIDPASTLVEAYVAEADITRLHPGQEALFLPEDNGPGIALVVTAVDATSTRAIDNDALASIHGGSIAVRQDGNHQLIPEQSLYRVTLAPREAQPPVRHIDRGSVKIAGDRSSLLASLWRISVAALVKESGL